MNIESWSPNGFVAAVNSIIDDKELGFGNNIIAEWKRRRRTTEDEKP